MEIHTACPDSGTKVITMHTLKTLIANCITLCGGHTQLAQRIGVHRPEISALALGTRPISPVTVGQLCDLLTLDGIDAQRLAVEAVIASAKPEKQVVLRRAFFAQPGTAVLCLTVGCRMNAALSTSGRQAESVGID